MINAAARMKALGQRQTEPGAPSSIFGSSLTLAHSIETEERFRLALYPIICADTPEVAMGLAACLAYLLEQYPSTRVYRCVARLDPADEGAEISASDYQFHFSDWELEGLADNTLLWGRLEVGADGMFLQLSLDASLLDDGEIEEFEYRFPTLADGVGALPGIAADIARALAEDAGDQAVISYRRPATDSRALAEVLEYVFDWNLDVYLHFWGVPWNEADLESQFLTLAKLLPGEDDEFACWCLGMMAKQVMQAGLEELGEFLTPMVRPDLFAQGVCASGAAAAAIGLAQLDKTETALDLLQPHLDADSAPSLWLSAIEIYLDAGHFDEALDTAQVALEGESGHPALYWRYVELLMAAETNDWEVEALLLIEPEAYADEEHIGREIVSALKLQLAGAPGNLAALQLALTYMIDFDDEELWEWFEQLVRQDRAGAYLGDALDRLLDLEDYDPAYAILERQVDNNPFAYVYLSQLALADDNLELARATIAQCRNAFARLDDDLELELQRLELAANLPGFEEAFAEVKLMLGENRSISEETVELLESAVEAAPKLIDLHVVLSRCYLSWKDSESAYEVLNDAKEAAGSHPQIDQGLAQILWSTGKQEEAIAKLNAGLEEYPNSVALLALMANYLLSNNQLEDARDYIARAEAIAPSHRALWQLRRAVAEKMAG